MIWSFSSPRPSQTSIAVGEGLMLPPAARRFGGPGEVKRASRPQRSRPEVFGTGSRNCTLMVLIEEEDVTHQLPFIHLAFSAPVK